MIEKYRLPSFVAICAAAFGAAKVVRTGFSVLKTVPGAKEGEIAVVPVADLFAREKDAVRREALRKDVLAVVQAFAGKVIETVQQEYR